MRQLVKTQTFTIRDDPSFDRYLKEIKKIPLLTAEEEVELAVRIQDGDEVALEKLVRSNLRFVVFAAKRHKREGDSISDMIQEGNIGLTKAAKRFDHTRGFRFISFAVWYIRQHIIDYLAKNRELINLSEGGARTLYRINKITALLEQKYEGPPPMDVLAEALEMPEEMVEAALKNKMRFRSLDSPVSVSSEDSPTLVEILANQNSEKPEYISEKRNTEEVVENLLGKLTQREKEIICLYYGIGEERTFTIEEITKRFEITRQRAYQIKEKAERKIRYYGNQQREDVRQHI